MEGERDRERGCRAKPGIQLVINISVMGFLQYLDIYNDL